MDYVIIDLEATCWEGSAIENMESIEIGAVRLDGDFLEPTSDFQQFVTPADTRKLEPRITAAS